LSTTTQQFNGEALGQWTDPFDFEVTKERIVAYAEATNDDIPQHAAGEFAPPVFAIVPAFGVAAQPTTTVIPPELLMMVLHGEQDFHFHRPIEPGMKLQTRAAAIGVHPRSSGVTVVVKSETKTDSGEPVVDQYMTSFVRGASGVESQGEEAPPHSFPEELRESEPEAVVVQTFDEDQTFRYSEASGDPMPIHLDDDLAKAMGLPGIIIHGLCTMAFTSRAVIQTACPEDPSRLRRLAVRFSKPVQPKQSITTTIWRGAEGSYAYETSSDDGAIVIKDGLAEIS
jgi:acyl dehydratase